MEGQTGDHDLRGDVKLLIGFIPNSVSSPSSNVGILPNGCQETYAKKNYEDNITEI
jgi:hypothetical protein